MPPNPTQIKRIEEGLKLGMTREIAAKYAAVPLSSFYRWLSQGEANISPVYREFWEAVNRAESLNAAGALASVHKAAQGGVWQAGAWIMERRHGYRAIPDPHPISSPGDDPTSPESQARLVEALRQVPVSLLAHIDPARLKMALQLAEGGGDDE